QARDEPGDQHGERGELDGLGGAVALGIQALLAGELTEGPFLEARPALDAASAAPRREPLELLPQALGLPARLCEVDLVDQRSREAAGRGLHLFDRPFDAQARRLLAAAIPAVGPRLRADRKDEGRGLAQRLRRQAQDAEDFLLPLGGERPAPGLQIAHDARRDAEIASHLVLGDVQGDAEHGDGGGVGWWQGTPFPGGTSRLLLWSPAGHSSLLS